MWFFVSDLHGRVERYEKLFALAARERPAALLLGGDLLPCGLAPCEHDDFIGSFLAPAVSRLRDLSGAAAPDVFLILGNDDPRAEEQHLLEHADAGLWHYVHGGSAECQGVRIFGYACVPPTPFLLKDWERYDVSRYIDPGCVSPEEGRRSVPVPPEQIRYATIKEDLESMAGGQPLERSVWLFHAPPYQTVLDRAALDDVKVEHVQVDVHVGSIAIRRFIERHQPLLTLHGHIHESARLTGKWQDCIGRTRAFTAAHDGPELALVRLDPAHPETATRELI